MKIMTLNTHSLMEKDNAQALRAFVAGVLKHRPDVIALQEVNQHRDGQAAEDALLEGYVPAQTAVPLRQDNYAAHAARLLREAGVQCSWTYLPVKTGYGCFDEGLAVLALDRRISRTESFLISRGSDYAHWKTRKVLGVQLEGCQDWFYNVHMGWWHDEEEPFMVQWKVLHCFLTTKPRHAPVWLMGDFNSPAEIRDEGYDSIADTGWYDTYTRARRCEGSCTMPGGIDGWQGAGEEALRHGLRIDHVWCSMPVEVASSRVVFDGSAEPVISDHYGVLVEAFPGAETELSPLTWDEIAPDALFDAL